MAGFNLTRPLGYFVGYTFLMSRMVKPGSDGKLDWIDKLLIGIWVVGSIVIGVVGVTVGGFMLYVIATSL